MEHERCGELNGGVEGEWVWMTCTCGATLLRVSDGEIRQVLLHEMCHTLKGCSSHGKQFQRQLARLAARGEAWAEHQRQEYAS